MGGGEPFGSPETGRVIRFTSPTAVLAIRHRFKGSPTQMAKSDRIGDRPAVKLVELADPIQFLKTMINFKTGDHFGLNK